MVNNMKLEEFGMDLHLYEEYKPECPVKDAGIIFVLEGEISVKIGQNAYPLMKDDLILINIGQTYQLEITENSLICLITISRDLLYAEMHEKDVYFWCNSAAGNNNYRPLKNIIGSLIVEYSIDMDSMNLRKRALFYQLLDQLLNHYLLESASRINGSIQDSTLSKVIAYIQENYKKPISLSTAANQAFMSESAFSRYFKKNTGINFLEYLHNLRLKNAVEELLHTEKTIIDIAMDNGFTNPSMFSKAFRKSYSMSPTEYKKTVLSKMYLPDQKTDISQNEQYKEKLAQLVRTNYRNEENDIARYHISIDAADSHPYKKIWNQCINAGSAVSLLQIKMQEHLCEINKELGITYVRICNIFGWETRIRKDRKTVNFNFELIDNVLDFLVNNGMKPVFETAQKPDRVFIDVGNIVPLERTDSVFESLDEFLRILEKFAGHIVKRYGMEEVKSWIFDLGQNPTLHIDDKYFEMFNAAGGIIKSYIPTARVGGGCIPLGVNLNPILDSWIRDHRRPDFISCIAFPYQETDSRKTFPGSVKHSPDPHYFFNEIQKMKKTIHEYGAGDIPLVIAEWNLSFSDRNFYNDSCGKAAQMMMNMVECMETVEAAAYLYATDLNTRNYDTDTMLFGGTGLMSKDGLAKPVFYAFQFLNRLGSRLIRYGDRYIAATDGGGTYDIIIFNYKAFNYNYYMKTEDEIKAEDLPGIFENNDPVDIVIELTGIKAGEYYIESETLGVRYGSILSAWRDLNYEPSLNRNEQRYIKRISTPRITIRKQSSAEGKLVITELLEAHDIRLIHIYK